MPLISNCSFAICKISLSALPAGIIGVSKTNPPQTSKTESLATIVNGFWPLAIAAKPFSVGASRDTACDSSYFTTK